MGVFYGGGTLPLTLRSPVVPVGCAKLHALWSVGIARWSARRASRGFGGGAGSKVKGPVLRDMESQPEYAQTQLPKGQPGVLGPAGGEAKGPKKRGRCLR
jgi:hypothetical protein